MHLTLHALQRSPPASLSPRTPHVELIFAQSPRSRPIISAKGRVTCQARHSLTPPSATATGAIAPTATAAAEQAAAAQAATALARLLHPTRVGHANLVPALQTVLQSLHQRPSSRSWERALLSSPLLLGLVSWATELVEQPQAAAVLGPEAPLLVLEILSHVGGAGSTSGAWPVSDRLAQHCRRLWRHAHAALGDATDVAGKYSLMVPDLMSPEALVRYYEACARTTLGGTPSKSSGMGLMLRHNLQNRRFTLDEGVRLLVAWSQLRRRIDFNPDSYNFASLAAHLANNVDQLNGQQLQAVAAATPAFEWPVYRSMPLLHAICRSAVHRSLMGTVPLPAAQRVLASSIKGAAAMRPRLAQELESATCDWMREAAASRARQAAAAAAAAAPAQPPAASTTTAAAAPTSTSVPPAQWLRGAALAVTAECSNNIVRASALVPWLGTTSLLALALLHGGDAIGAAELLDAASTAAPSDH